MYMCVCVLYHFSVCFHSGIVTITPHLGNLLYITAAMPLAICSVPSPSYPDESLAVSTRLGKLLKLCFRKHGRLNKCWGSTNKDLTTSAPCCWLLDGNCVGKWKTHLDFVQSQTLHHCLGCTVSIRSAVIWWPERSITVCTPPMVNTECV